MGIQYFEFALDKPLKYMLTGKLAPQIEFSHRKRKEMSDYELMVITEGVAHMSDGMYEYAAKAGDFLLFPKGSPQFGTRESHQHFYWLHFLPYHSLRIAESPTDCPVDEPYLITLPSFGSTSSLEKIIVLMKQLQDSIRTYNDPIQNDYMTTAIICELYNQINSVKTPGMPAFKHKQLYNDIIDYVQWHKNHKLTVSKVAQYFGYNEKYMSQLFCNLSGISLKQYIQREKMEKAKFLLTDTNQPVYWVADQLGFTDSHNFMKAFKKITGTTPSEYRNIYSKRILNAYYSANE